MPILSVGIISKPIGRCNKSRDCSGITLIELLVVVAIIGLLVGISYPSLASGIDSLRLNTATNTIVAFFDAGLNRAERLQQVVDVTVSQKDNLLQLRTPSNAAFLRELNLPDGVTISKILPELPEPTDSREFFLYPGGTAPSFGVQLTNRRGAMRVVQIDAMTGTPVVSKPQP